MSATVSLRRKHINREALRNLVETYFIEWPSKNDFILTRCSRFESVIDALCA